MEPSLALLDWLVIAAYLAFLIIFALYLSRSQHSRDDYYVGSRSVGAWPVAISIMATQCSTSSIMGAPAFVAFSAGGGLVWLQYELAVPLAMIVLMLFAMPLFRHLRLISVYAYLEQRFDLRTRLVLSALFLFVRAFATAVTVYGIALVIDLITGVGFFWAVVLLGAFTVVYDIFGGIRGVIYSDVLQLGILVAVLWLLFVLLVQDGGGLANMWQSFEPARRQALDFSHHGLGDGETFAFWPMLFGGLFLYLAYYGCDQSQVQRELSTDNIDSTNRALLINGFLRFPLVALYCFVGVGIAVFATNSPDFLQSLPRNGDAPEYNLAVPFYMIYRLPAGLVGLAMVALFAAAMSSLDSVLNSLSATTMEDFVRRCHRARPGTEWTQRKELLYSRLITAAWGAITLAMAFLVGDIAPTVLEAINKIGSLANGPILAVFALGILTKRIGAQAALLGLALGLGANALSWLLLPELSWLWWNVSGFFVSVASAFLLNPLFESFRPRAAACSASPLPFTSASRVLASEARLNWHRRSAYLCAWFILLLLALAWLGTV